MKRKDTNTTQREPPIEIPRIFRDRERTLEKLPLDVLAMADGIQARTQNDEDTIRKYVYAMREGATFPPILVTRRLHTPEMLMVIDGFHRIEAALRHCEYERKDIRHTYLEAVVIRPYWEQEELEATLLINTTHGLPLTKADNKRRLELAHTIPRLRELPSRRLAQHLGGIHHSTISRWRQKNGFTLEDDGNEPFSPDPQAKFWQPSIRSIPTTPNRPKFPKPLRTKSLARLAKMLEDTSMAAPENIEDTINRNVLKHKIRPQVVDATLLEVREIIDAILYARKTNHQCHKGRRGNPLANPS